LYIYKPASRLSPDCLRPIMSPSGRWWRQRASGGVGSFSSYISSWLCLLARVLSRSDTGSRWSCVGV